MEEHEKHEKLPVQKETITPAPHSSPSVGGKTGQEHLTEHRYTDIVTLLSWQAPARPFQKRSKEYFMNILMISALIEVILFLFGQYLLMAVIVALVFLAYTLSTVPPHNAHYKITSEGILVEDNFFIWEELYDFHFKHQRGQDVLIVSTKAWIPGEIIITLGDLHLDHVKRVLLAYLPYREYVKPTFLEKSGNWLEKNFPLEKVTSSHNS